MTIQQATYLELPAPRPPRTRTSPKVLALREAITPYVDVVKLRELAAMGGDIRGALTGQIVPPEVEGLIDLLAALLLPTSREQIKSPVDVAGLLMTQVSHLDQEEFRVVCIDTKNRVQRIVTVYRGTVDSANIRVGEVFKEALRLNSRSVILCHNHPSGDPSPSPEDVMVTNQIIQAGCLLDVDVLDHIVIGQGRWTSLRERGLAFK